MNWDWVSLVACRKRPLDLVALKYVKLANRRRLCLGFSCVVKNTIVFPLSSKLKQVNEVIAEWNLRNIRDKETRTCSRVGMSILCHEIGRNELKRGKFSSLW